VVISSLLMGISPNALSALFFKFYLCTLSILFTSGILIDFMYGVSFSFSLVFAMKEIPIMNFYSG